MNINLLLTKINHSNLDDAIKKSLATILDRALNDADSVARLEAEIRNQKEGLEKVGMIPMSNPFYKILVQILHGDKPIE